MIIIYTEHLRNRLELRKIGQDLPKDVYLKAEAIFYDKITKHYIAISKQNYLNKIRTLAVAFDRFSDKVELITIHPIPESDISKRLSSGRWVRQ